VGERKIRAPHSWKVTPAQARIIQRELAEQVAPVDRLAAVHTVGGIDVGLVRGTRLIRAAAVVLSFPELRLVDAATTQQPVTFPYIPGLLSFRETPAVLAALEKLHSWPDLLFCDGHGYAHPRRFGLACHVGLLTDLPAIGVGKTRLIGTYEPVPRGKESWVPLIHHREIIGAVVRTRTDVKPVYVSIGHKISLETAIRFVLQCTPKFKLPEPIRRAHAFASGNIPP
jgi:deoxyribonuclease V